MLKGQSKCPNSIWHFFSDHISQYRSTAALPMELGAWKTSIWTVLVTNTIWYWPPRFSIYARHPLWSIWVPQAVNELTLQVHCKEKCLHDNFSHHYLVSPLTKSRHICDFGAIYKCLELRTHLPVLTYVARRPVTLLTYIANHICCGDFWKQRHKFDGWQLLTVYIVK